jgi:hypothetical protein
MYVELDEENGTADDEQTYTLCGSLGAVMV